MIKVHVRYGTTLAEAAGIREMEATLADGECTLLGLLRKLATSGPKSLATELMDTRSGRPLCLAMVNGRLIAPSTVMVAPLKDGDKVSLIAPMSGGSSPSGGVG